MGTSVPPYGNDFASDMSDSNSYQKKKKEEKKKAIR